MHSYSQQSSAMTQISATPANDVNNTRRVVKKRYEHCKLLMAILEGPDVPVIIDFTECLRLSSPSTSTPSTRSQPREAFNTNVFVMSETQQCQGAPDHQKRAEIKKVSTKTSSGIKKPKSAMGKHQRSDLELFLNLSTHRLGASFQLKRKR